MALGVKAKIAGVMGWPVNHSLSPKLHNYWLEQYHLDGVYVPLPVAPQDLREALRALPAQGMRGVNLTIPHKVAAMSIVDEVDEQANRIGAINTVVVREDNTLLGLNTDAYGFIENLASQGDLKPYLDRVLVIGAGGAARAVVAALQGAGAKEIIITNRTFEKADALVKLMSAYSSVTQISWEKKEEALPDVTLLINTSSLGMKGQPALEISLDALPRNSLVTDIVYAPLETPLLAEAKKRGNPTVDGFGMLLYQAQEAFRYWFGITPEVTLELRKHVLS